MKSKIHKTAKKDVVSKMIAQLSEVEKLIERASLHNGNTQLTFLLKLDQKFQGDITESKEIYVKLKAYWQKLLGPKTDFGFFRNAEIGTLFVAGPLSEVFLFDIERKKLGELCGGPYGILRALGITEAEADRQIKKLNEGLYLLLIKEKPKDLIFLEDNSETLDKAG